MFGRLKGMCLLHYFSVWKETGKDNVFKFSATNIKYNRMRFCFHCGKIELYKEEIDNE